MTEAERDRRSAYTASLSGRVNVTLNAVTLDAEERRIRALRAAEILEGASWLFDEFISEQTREMIATDISQTTERDILHVSITAAMGLKAHLLTIIQNHQAEITRNERRDRAERPADAS